MTTFESIISGKSKGLLPGVARRALGGLSLLYRAGTGARNFLYDRKLLNQARLPCPVISVGNLTVGGTGKTPLVEYIARHFIKSGRRVVILSRGYRARKTPGGIRNDEAEVLAANVPDAAHIQSKNRVTAGIRAVRRHRPHCIILDDGFQHRRLKRDLDILVIDAANPFGHGRLLPRGLLREPKRCARRAHGIVISKCDEAERRDFSRSVAVVVDVTAPGAEIFRSVYAPVAIEALNEDDGGMSPEEARGRRVFAFCGIGAGRSFHASLEKLGCDIAKMMEFPDHHRYTDKDIDKIKKEFAASDAEFAITTQKDAVKLKSYSLPRVFFLKIEMEFTDSGDGFPAFLNKIVN